MKCPWFGYFPSSNDILGSSHTCSFKMQLSLLGSSSFNALGYCLTEFSVRILIRTNGGGVELSWALSKTCCRQQFRNKEKNTLLETGVSKIGIFGTNTSSCEAGAWSGLRIGLVWCSHRREACPQLEGKTCTGTSSGCRWEMGWSWNWSCWFLCLVNLGHPSPAAAVSLHQDILWAFVAALGHCPGWHWGGCAAGHPGIAALPMVRRQFWGLLVQKSARCLKHGSTDLKVSSLSPTRLDFLTCPSQCSNVAHSKSMHVFLKERAIPSAVAS